MRTVDRMATVARIVVPLDFTHVARRALAAGATLAPTLHARLEVVTVAGYSGVDPREAWGLARSVGCQLDAVEEIPPQGAERALSRLARDASTLLCVASHGRTAVGELVLGSTSAAVMRRAEQPLVLVGPRCPGRPPAPFRNLVAGLPEQEPDLSHLLLEVVRWADLGLQPWLLEVHTPTVAAQLPADVAESGSVQRAAELLNEAGVNAEWEVLHGDHAARELARFGAERGDAIGLVATHGREGLKHLTLGSVALELVHDAPWPVIVVPPRFEPARLEDLAYGTRSAP